MLAGEYKRGFKLADGLCNKMLGVEHKRWWRTEQKVHDMEMLLNECSEWIMFIAKWNDQSTIWAPTYILRRWLDEKKKKIITLSLSSPVVRKENPFGIWVYCLFIIFFQGVYPEVIETYCGGGVRGNKIEEFHILFKVYIVNAC